MTTSTQQPLAGSVSKQQGVRKLPLGLLLLVLLGLLAALWPIFTMTPRLMEALAKAGWNTVVDPQFFTAACLLNVDCSNAFLAAVIANYPWIWLTPLIGTLFLYVIKGKPQEYVVKDPGMAWWAQANDKGIEQYLSHGKGDNKLLGYLGHLMSVNRDGAIDYKRTVPLYVRQNALSENVLVLGGVGAGKTRGYFRPLIMLAAHLGFSIIVFDLKYPQADSGFFDMVGYWKKRGRDVMLFTPFSENTMRLPLLDSVTDYASALSMASTVMPPPEYSAEPGKHYRDRDRGVLAAFILAVAQSDSPSFAELLRFSRFTPDEMKTWYQAQVTMNEFGEVVQNLKGIFAQGDKEVASVLQGIKNAMKIFYDPRVARATQSLEGENMDVRAAFRRPTMLYVGIQQEFMMEGQGVVLLQLVKRYIDAQIMKEAEAQGGRFKRHVAYILDEFPSFGQLPYMMRSLGVLRSFNVSHHIGLQTMSQLDVVYGSDYAKALTTNVIGRTIFYPLAITGEERQTLSEYIGDTTVYEFSDTDSRRAFMGTQLDDASRSGVSMKKVARPLLPPEEFPHFRPMEAVITSRGVNPIRTFMPAIEDEFLEGPEIPHGIPNGLFALYKKVNPERENMGAYTTRLLQSGEFGIKNPVMGLGEDRTERWNRMMTEWLETDDVTFRLSGEQHDRIYITFRREEHPEQDVRALAGFYQEGYTNTHTGQDIMITAKGMAALKLSVQERLMKHGMLGGLENWLAEHAQEIEGDPSREGLDNPPEVQAIIRGQDVFVRFAVAKKLYGAAPESLAHRIKAAQYIRIDRNNPAEIFETVQAIKDQKSEQESSPLGASSDENETVTSVSASSVHTASWETNSADDTDLITAQQSEMQTGTSGPTPEEQELEEAEYQQEQDIQIFDQDVSEDEDEEYEQIERQIEEEQLT